MNDTQLIKRLHEKAERSYNNNQYTFTDFLSLSELSEFYAAENELKYAGPVVYGGSDLAERRMIRFGNPELLGYEEPFPIVFILITPLQQKFADSLSHRDFLGALMNLGIERTVLGDIFIKENEACLVAHIKMADYICENLTRIRHTAVRAVIVDEPGEVAAPKLTEKIIQVMSERVDAVISKVYNLSRGDSLELVQSEKVFVNGRQCTENARPLRAGDVVSVRGFGKFAFDGLINTSKKGKINCRIQIYT